MNWYLHPAWRNDYAYRETKKKMTREQLIEDLRTHVLIVHFTKADGSDRRMRCTLKSDLLPAQSLKESINSVHEPKQDNLNTVRVFDLDKFDWRSFRVDSVIEVESV